MYLQGSLLGNDPLRCGTADVRLRCSWALPTLSPPRRRSGGEGHWMNSGVVRDNILAIAILDIRHGMILKFERLFIPKGITDIFSIFMKL